jgi:hypothetical protein
MQGRLEGNLRLLHRNHGFFQTDRIRVGLKRSGQVTRFVLCLADLSAVSNADWNDSGFPAAAAPPDAPLLRRKASRIGLDSEEVEVMFMTRLAMHKL